MRVRSPTALVVCGAVAACSGGGQSTPEPAAGATGMQVPADELSFLLGRWQQVDGPATIEERWVRSPDGDLLGSGRVTVQGMLGFAEALSIVRAGDTLTFVAWPTGQDPTPYQRARSAPNEVEFVNPNHDFPQRIKYSRVDDHTLNAEATGVVKGEPKSESWTMTLVLPPAAPSPEAERADAPVATPPAAAASPAPAPKAENAAQAIGR
jgi:hypothetical protein